MQHLSPRTGYGRAMPFVPVLAAALALIFGTPAVAQNDEPRPEAESTSAGSKEVSSNAPVNEIRWKTGPTKADLGDIAEIDIPADYVFADGDDTRRLMEQMNNLVSGQELGFVGPPSQEWFVVFEYSDSGHVKDDERDELDAGAMLASIREGTELANEERKRRGWDTMKILGWSQPPKYDVETHNLEWAPKAQSSEGSMIVNYNTRLLGRTGVMEVALVVGPDKLEAALPLFKTLLKGFSFKAGHTYAEYREGDKLAEYGLAALVTGGAAAVALKTGLLAKLGGLLAKMGKGVVLVIIAIGAALKGIFSKLSGRKNDIDVPPGSV